MPSPFISREEKFATKKPSFARNVSFRVLRNPPACLIKGSLHTTTLMSACVGKVLMFLHRHTSKRTSGCLTIRSTPLVKYYIRIGVRLSQKTILSCAKNFYRDEHSADPPSNALGPAWFHRFLVRNGISTTLYDPLDALRVNSATEHNARNFYESFARTAVKHGFAKWNLDFDENERSSQMIMWDDSKLHRVFTFDEAKLLLAYEKGVRGVRILTIKGEDNPRPSVTANDSFAASVMECRNLAGEALAPYFVCNKNADVADDFDIPGTIIDTSAGKPQEAQWIRGTSKGHT